MSRSEVQKIKLLALYDFLRRETDENNPLSTAEIIEGLKPDGMPVIIRTPPKRRYFRALCRIRLSPYIQYEQSISLKTRRKTEVRIIFG